MQREEEVFIRNAFLFLENPSFLIRLADKIGRPLELAAQSLPMASRRQIQKVTEKALRHGLVAINKTVTRRKGPSSFTRGERRSRITARWHTVASFGVGAAGGMFGALSLPIELPLTTAIILRSVVAIAEEFGMNLEDPRTQLECLYILSLGSPRAAAGEGAIGAAYWTSRAAFHRLANEAATYLAGKSAPQLARALEGRSVPVLGKLLAQIASRFEVVVSEKFLAEVVPVLGALGGATLNAAFTDYFSQAARYHFGLRALENKHGRAAVEQCFQDQQTGEEGQ